MRHELAGLDAGGKDSPPGFPLTVDSSTNLEGLKNKILESFPKCNGDVSLEYLSETQEWKELTHLDPLLKKETKIRIKQSGRGPAQSNKGSAAPDIFDEEEIEPRSRSESLISEPEAPESVASAGTTVTSSAPRSIPGRDTANNGAQGAVLGVPSGAPNLKPPMKNFTLFVPSKDGNRKITVDAGNLAQLRAALGKEMKFGKEITDIEFQPQHAKDTWVKLSNIKELPELAKIRFLPTKTFDLLVVLGAAEGNRKKTVTAGTLDELKQGLRDQLGSREISRIEWFTEDDHRWIEVEDIDRLPLHAKVRVVEASVPPVYPNVYGRAYSRQGYHHATPNPASPSVSPTLSLASLSPASHLSSCFSSPASSMPTPSPSPPPRLFLASARQGQSPASTHELNRNPRRPPVSQEGLVTQYEQIREQRPNPAAPVFQPSGLPPVPSDASQASTMGPSPEPPTSPTKTTDTAETKPPAAAKPSADTAPKTVAPPKSEPATNQPVAEAADPIERPGLLASPSRAPAATGMAPAPTNMAPAPTGGLLATPAGLIPRPPKPGAGAVETKVPAARAPSPSGGLLRAPTQQAATSGRLGNKASAAVPSQLDVEDDASSAGPKSGERSARSKGQATPPSTGASGSVFVNVVGTKTVEQAGLGAPWSCRWLRVRVLPTFFGREVVVESLEKDAAVYCKSGLGHLPAKKGVVVHLTDGNLPCVVQVSAGRDKPVICLAADSSGCTQAMEWFRGLPKTA